jgi:hypothetical protein
VDLFLSSFISSVFLSPQSPLSLTRPLRQSHCTKEESYCKKKKKKKDYAYYVEWDSYASSDSEDEKQSKKPSIQGQSPPVEEKLGSLPLGCSKF